MDNLKFRISSALKDLVGKELITSDNVAIFELVKNAYDAYATKVVISFLEDKIIIADNGRGMTFDEIQKKWLFVGFSEKKKRIDNINKQQSYRDKIKRYYAGAKGIGRFSCDRLGRMLTITTTSQNSSTTDQISLDWKDFEKDQSIEFSEINVSHSILSDHISYPEDSSHGTVIEITHLHDDETPWTRKHLLELKRSLEKLINPLSEVNDFSIEIVCEREQEEDDKLIESGKGYDRDIVNGILKNSISTILKLKTTQIDVTVNPDYVTTTLSDRGIEIYKIRETNVDYSLISDATVSLSFLNRAAKYNFSRLMGVDAVNYGSVFLFRNGFRILPFGNTGDDSWRMDFRAQQGYNRYLGSRDLLGRVDIHTDNVSELKEVSSRDGGLVDTQMSRQVMKLFETTHRRLERYVVGVLWGEGFLKNEYFASKEEGEEERRKLHAKDKDSESPNYVIDNSIGSKIDFIKIIKSLSTDPNVEILYYNSEFANLLNEQSKSDSIKPQFIKDLETIATRTGNETLLKIIGDAKRRIEQLSKEKIDAQRKAEEAERKAADAVAQQIKAEQKANEEEEKRKIAELDKLKAENEKVKAENARLIAIQKAAEEEKRRQKAEKEKKIESLKAEFYKKASTPDTDALIHHVKNNNSRINDAIADLLNTIPEEIKKLPFCYTLIESLTKIRNLSLKSLKATDLILSCDLAPSDSQKINLPLFFDGYLKSEVHKKINCHFSSNTECFYVLGSKLDLGLVLDNFINNSLDWNAKNLWINCDLSNNKLYVHIFDDGLGLSQKFSNDPEEIFNFATSGKKTGTGFGMYLIKETLKNFHATIHIETPADHKGIHFLIIFE